MSVPTVKHIKNIRKSCWNTLHFINNIAETKHIQIHKDRFNMKKRGNNAQLNNINKITEIYQTYPKILSTTLLLIISSKEIFLGKTCYYKNSRGVNDLYWEYNVSDSSLILFNKKYPCSYFPMVSKSSQSCTLLVFVFGIGCLVICMTVEISHINDFTKRSLRCWSGWNTRPFPRLCNDVLNWFKISLTSCNKLKWIVTKCLWNINGLHLISYKSLEEYSSQIR
jgi:hypothetical protein